jgi:hypothetical protein
MARKLSKSERRRVDDAERSRAVAPRSRLDRPRRIMLTAAEEAEIFRLRADGASPADIARAFGQPLDLVCRLLGLRCQSEPAHIDYELRDDEASRWMRYQTTKAAEALIRARMREGRTLEEISEEFGLPLEDLIVLTTGQRRLEDLPFSPAQQRQQSTRTG